MIIDQCSIRFTVAFLAQGLQKMWSHSVKSRGSRKRQSSAALCINPPSQYRTPPAHAQLNHGDGSRPLAMMKLIRLPVNWRTTFVCQLATPENLCESCKGPADVVSLLWPDQSKDAFWSAALHARFCGKRLQWQWKEMTRKNGVRCLDAASMRILWLWYFEFNLDKLDKYKI